MPKLTARAALAVALALPAAALPGLASAQGRPASRPPAAPKAPAAEAPPAIFPCRTASEVCYLGIVTGGKLAVIYTNTPNGQDIGAKPVEVTAGEGAKVDLGPQDGRVVMMTGTYDPKAGLTKAELVEVASPLASLALKAQLLGGGDEKAAPPRRR